MTDQTARAWAYLARVAEPPCPAVAGLVDRVGPVDAAELIRRGDVDDRLAKRTEARRDWDCAATDLELMARLGGRLVTAADPDWPVLAFTAFGGADRSHRPDGHPPLALWVIGELTLDAVAGRSAAIVGTRAASSYGEHVAADLATGLAARDVAVISGGAYGIDGVAHRAALAAEGLTVAVLAGGVDVRYPAGHAGLLQRIAEHGLLISEYPPGTRPSRRRFLTRNRLVAALSGATVVVEAGIRSGAANTAAWAETLGRPVGAVPGPVTSATSVGCHVLLRERAATVITRAEEVVELVGRCGELAPDLPRPSSPLDDLTDAELLVYEALPARAARTVDQIAVACGMPPQEVLAPLSMLELAGLVVRRDGRWQLARR
ncbi:DNA-processing protein DprA [Mycolicibacterium thermoresistibile]|jgi:DNA processing protein|uniref:DNA protecting protein DprA n=2 Tax=Mycolicibacterium thermoresistibile TaxID=1797 RepID=G7CKN8_MYCT3|nr:DNA-processing protein DprA [Mycolicibacterium thermoresistibile]EHI12945.1 DNA protecting protein DprA [Mycolicibacterium thermoresistibile ATCC 19527]MCV7188085.1 DNA-protecting protein DprA [Mycolicibacterium thermoresistibile]GAT17258.1 DNA protecting protein DprA [Mycolicibacterium thermoresistibile]SNW17822.1 DNA protecting protein DprA [Mycolicibacterium thermoresistibile]